MARRFLYLLLLVALSAPAFCAGERRKVIIDQDAAGPGGTVQQAILLLIQSPQTEVLGITVVTGDQWRDEEVAHTLRTLEIIGRTDIPVVPGAEYPLLRRKADTELWERRYGSVAWLGAWTPRLWHEADVVPPLPEGQPTTKPAAEDAAHFLVRMVRRYPHQVTIYEGGPMTNLALAISIDPQFASLACPVLVALLQRGRRGLLLALDRLGASPDASNSRIFSLRIPGLGKNSQRSRNCRA